MTVQIGIMQGRLSDPVCTRIQSFPKNSWKKEFSTANSLGFKTIEWVFDSHDNPILDNEELSEIKKIKESVGIEINSVCADYFMDKRLFGSSEIQIQNNLKKNFELIKNCYQIGISIIEIPLVDNSSIRDLENQKEFESNLQKILDVAKNFGVTIALETDLEPIRLNNWISKINHPNLMLNYDIGNSTACKFDIEEEWNLLHEWIVNVHVKDRFSGGNTVPFGEGDSNFDLFFKLLRQKNYEGDLIIQGAREDLEKNKTLPIETNKKYLRFVNEYLDKYQ